MDGAIDVFSAHAADYQALRRRLVPCFDAFYGTAADLVGRRGGAILRVLDVGAGTGLMSAAVLARHPQAQLVLLDGSAEMLGEAGKHLASERVAAHVADMHDELPEGPYDAVVSALAIHHLEHPAQRDLFSRILGVLRPGGVFVNAEQVCGPTAWLDDLYSDWWRRDCRAAGAGEGEIGEAEVRMRVDRCTDVATQLQWMTEAGFGDVECFYKQTRFAVLAGWRPELKNRM